MATYVTRFIKRYRGALSVVGIGVAATAGELETLTPRIYSIAGAPSFATTEAVALAIRNDAAGATTVLYVTADNGTTWTALT
jgi:dihydrodipicolinate synthase/N-acetylneuraminate lyase